MRARDRHLNTIHLIREALSQGPKNIEQIHEATGVHRITIIERLADAECWGIVSRDDEMFSLVQVVS